jgi:prenyltransferase beta subunit
MKRFYPAFLFYTVFLVPALGQTPEQKKATIAFVKGLQMPDGGFLAAPVDKTEGQPAIASLRATSAGLRALMYFGGETQQKEACAQFVKKCFDRGTGGFSDRPGGKPDVVSTAVGVMAAVELKLPVDEYRDGVIRYLSQNAKSFEDIRIAAAGFEALGAHPPVAEKWLTQITRMQNSDGTYGKGDGVARATGGAAVAVLRLGGKLMDPEHVIQVLRQGQRQDGGFGKEGTATSDLESSYRIMRAFAMLKKKPDGERCRAFVATCRNPDGGYGVAPGQPSHLAATYFASIILHWLEDEK